MMKQSISIMLLTGILLAGIPAWAQQYRHETVHQVVDIENRQRLEVILDIDAAEFYITKGEQPGKVIIDLNYLKDEFRHRIDYDQRRNRLYLNLDKRGWGNIKDKNHDENISRVEIKLPEDVEIYLDATLKAGEASLSLGALRLKEVTLNNWAGDVEVRFDEPNLEEMDFFDVNAKVGEARLLRLGNARFRRADINGGIGELRVDFTGKSLAGSRAKVDLDIGEARIVLSDLTGLQVRIDGMFSFMSSKDIDFGLHRRGRSYYNDRYKDEKNAFLVHVTPGLGELRISLQDNVN